MPNDLTDLVWVQTRYLALMHERDAALARAKAAELERDEAGQILCEAHPALLTGNRRLPQVARDFVAEVKRTDAVLTLLRECLEFLRPDRDISRADVIAATSGELWHYTPDEAAVRYNLLARLDALLAPEGKR